ncbi:putative acyl-CoA dehydrogenase [Spathaspora passalidarum NRRL Y-27907]|uniref:Putative acyl-CoA dehydrogenase n=1 Tax=Spathaspora passalidarum (strain NRRL Y-27907 / 11-Y1) TaxID=619300 RepID=G3AJ65_SPAPN|nr:putative acyl-CoA dehydrogenase [Spathaspora passalidarum NRRL Y-27907]EGW33822.1 putative acyl-CoA dehydrogenase [Spathaspora passalidarum NRRL Y-27907]
MSITQDIPAIFLEKISPKGLEAIQKTKDFVHDYCLPADAIYLSQISNDPATRWTSTPPVMEKLKAKARELGLWNMFLSKHYPEGPGFTNLEYGLMARYLGRSYTAPEATNTAAPDTGNMELFAKYGTGYQKQKWLQPLLNGEIRSAFVMTEKGTSSSNALNICTSAKLNSKGNYVVNGHKWFASGAGDPRCSVWLVMCKTSDDSANPYRNHTVLVIDAKKAIASGKAKVVRPLHVIGYDDAPHGHCEIEFSDFEIPAEDMPHAVLAGVGRGFELIQSRLGPGRIHHCMRAIGAGEFALLRIAHRSNHRLIFGKPMNQRESFLTRYAQSRIDIERCLLLVLNAAHKIDISNAKAAQREIAMAKIETPRTIGAILDWGIQVFGAEGVSQDTELARMWANNRTLRIADGPDEAHLAQLARNEASRFGEVDKFFANFQAKRDRVGRL